MVARGGVIIYNIRELGLSVYGYWESFRGLGVSGGFGWSMCVYRVYGNFWGAAIYFPRETKIIVDKLVSDTYISSVNRD